MNAANVIMVVEDDHDLRESVCQLLEESGYQPFGLASGSAALAHLGSQQPKPGLILLDLALPGMSGWEFREAQLRDPAISAIPVVVITASRDIHGISADAVVYKPVEMGHLLEVVRSRGTPGAGGAIEHGAEAHVGDNPGGARPPLPRDPSPGNDVEPQPTRSAPVAALREGPSALQPTPDIAAARILVVDDNESVRQFVGRLLGGFFAKVETASDGKLALDMARANPPDLILSDVLMPGMNGLALVQELRSDARTRQIPIVLISGRAGEDSTLEALGAGADDYVVKPFSARELLARINVHLRMAHVRQQAAEQHAAGEALRRLSAEKDEFISLASHEFRTPLTTISLQADGLLRALSEPDLQPDQLPRLRKRVEMVKSSAFRLEGIIEGLLNVLELRGGQPFPGSGATDLGAVAREVVARFESAAVRVGSSLSLHGTQSLVGHWSRKALDQILSNLLSNAIKFGAGKPVLVTLEHDDVSARILVKDHGIGIDPKDHGRIFERFGRAVSETKFSGLGLGLWVVKNLVESMGGKVEVESTLGKGTLVKVEFPTALAADAGGGAPPANVRLEAP